MDQVVMRTDEMIQAVDLLGALSMDKVCSGVAMVPEDLHQILVKGHHHQWDIQKIHDTDHRHLRHQGTDHHHRRQPRDNSKDLVVQDRHHTSSKLQPQTTVELWRMKVLKITRRTRLSAPGK